MFNFLKRFRFIIISVLFIALSFTLGISFGRSHPSADVRPDVALNILNNDDAASVDNIDMASFWQVWKLLDEKYVPTKKVNATTTNQDRVWGAIQGMTNSLSDPYTVFMPPENAKEFQADISGNFEGVGMEIGIKDGALSVVSPLKGSPAEKAGIKAGDKILTIDGKPAVDLTTDKAVKLIRGPKNTVVKISVLRNGSGKSIDFSITRAVINVPTVKTEIKGDVFVISLYNFYAQAQTQFNDALKEFINSKKQKLILDLRGNPGGYLDSAVDMASWFLPVGKTVVREDSGNGNIESVYRSKGYDVFANDNLKMIILVDGGSASASEILAGALQENGIAKLVGEKTYGKGSVQELIPVGDSSLKVTIAKWLTPSGKSISEDGLIPDYVVKITDADLKAGLDPQINKAIELLDK